MSKRSVALTIVALAALALLALGSPALAKDGDVLVRGICTGKSTSKLKLSAENGRIEVEFEVDQNRNGVPWTVVLTRNGDARRPADAASRRRRAARSRLGGCSRTLPGADVVKATATRRGETCSARATFRV